MYPQYVLDVEGQQFEKWDQPLIQQPKHVPNMPLDTLNNVPRPILIPSPGLEYLSTLDKVLVKQELEIVEIVTGFQTKNKYSIENNLRQRVFFAAEESDFFTRLCCGSRRQFNMRIFDNFGNQVISMNRPLAMQSCCFPCCLQSMEVSAPSGNVIGTVEQEWSILRLSLVIKMASGEEMLYIRGPVCLCRCFNDIDFKILSKDKITEIGNITREWPGIIKSMYTNADNYCLTFPIDMDVNVKALLLGALFLIDYMYFEQPNK